MFFTVYGHSRHLGFVTWTKYINFFPPLLEDCIWNFKEINQVVSEKVIWKC